MIVIKTRLIGFTSNKYRGPGPVELLSLLWTPWKIPPIRVHVHVPSGTLTQVGIYNVASTERM